MTPIMNYPVIASIEVGLIIEGAPWMLKRDVGLKQERFFLITDMPEAMATIKVFGKRLLCGEEGAVHQRVTVMVVRPVGREKNGQTRDRTRDFLHSRGALCR